MLLSQPGSSEKAHWKGDEYDLARLERAEMNILTNTELYT